MTCLQLIYTFYREPLALPRLILKYQKQFTKHDFFCICFFIISVLPVISQATTDSAKFAEAQKLFAAGNLDAAHDIFFNLFKKDPGNQEVNFQLGRVSFAKGDYESAIMAFERVLIMDPRATRVKLEIARCHLNLGSKETARQLFQEVLDTNPPETVKKNIYNFLAAIKKSEKRHFLNGIISFGAGWDDNANSGQRDPERLIEKYGITSITESIEDFIYSNTNVINYKYVFPQKKFSWGITGLTYNSLYKEEGELDVGYYSLTTGPSIQTKKIGFETLGIYNYLFSDNEDYLESIGFSTSLSFLFSPHYLTIIKFKWEDREYKTNNEKNATNIEINFGNILIFHANTFNLTFSGEFNNTTDSNFDYNSYNSREGSISYDRQLPHNFSLSLSASYKFSKYLEKDPYDALINFTENKRADHDFFCLFAISKTIWQSRNRTKNLSSRLNYSFTKSKSNVDTYTYSKNTIDFGINLTF